MKHAMDKMDADIIRDMKTSDEDWRQKHPRQNFCSRAQPRRKLDQMNAEHQDEDHIANAARS